MHILATGLSGLVGSRLPELFPSHTFTDISLDSGFDILRPETLESAFSGSSSPVVIHLAAFTDTEAAWKQKGDKNGLCYQLNVVGTQNIVDLCRRHGKHLIHISTDYVFDGRLDRPYTEFDQPLPLDWYGETKFLAEKLVLDSQLPATIIRIASPYRANFPAKIDLVRKIIAKLSQGQECRLFSDQITTPTFVDDIAAGLEAIATNPRSGIYHLVGSSSQSVFKLGQMIAQVFGFAPELVVPSLLSDYLRTEGARPYPVNLSLSNDKFVDDYGLLPSTLLEGLEDLRSQLHS